MNLNLIVTSSSHLFNLQFQRNHCICDQLFVATRRRKCNYNSTIRCGRYTGIFALSITSIESHFSEKLRRIVKSFGINAQRYMNTYNIYDSVLFCIKIFKFNFFFSRSDTADVVTNKLKEESKAVYLTQLATFVELLPHIKRDLNRMKDITNGLRANASQLSDGLRSVKRELLQSLSKCQMDMCKKVLKEYEIGKLDVNGIDYDQVNVIFVFAHQQIQLDE